MLSLSGRNTRLCVEGAQVSGVHTGALMHLRPEEERVGSSWSVHSEAVPLTLLDGQREKARSKRSTTSLFTGRSGPSGCN